MLIDDIKKAKIEAMKSKNEPVKNVINIIVNKYMLLSIEKKEKSQDLFDSDVISIITKTLKELEEEKQGYILTNNSDRVNVIEQQIAFISSYLPKMLDENEIKQKILKLEDKSVSFVMKHFKTNFSGKVDLSLVNKVLKSI